MCLLWDWRVLLEWVVLQILSSFIIVMTIMVKKVLSLIFSLVFLSTSVFAVEVRLPRDASLENDLSINTVKSNNATTINSSNAVKKNDQTIFSVINVVNTYLWWSFGVIAMGLLVYAGYEAIMSWGDTKSMKKIFRICIGVGVWLFIAIISRTLIRIIVNLL